MNWLFSALFATAPHGSAGRPGIHSGPCAAQHDAARGRGSYGTQGTEGLPTKAAGARRLEKTGEATLPALAAACA